MPVPAKGKTRTGRLWTYVRDDRPFGGPDPPAAVFFYWPDRSAKHPEQHLATYAGLMQADAYAGFNKLYKHSRQPGPITEASCWAHARRQLFDLARINKSPIEKMIVTNTIPLAGDRATCNKIVVLSVARLLGQAIKSIHEETSVSSLFV